MMRTVFLAGVVTTLLVGCGKEPAVEAAAMQSPLAAEVAQAPMAEAVKCGSGEGFDTLPAGICLSESYRFRDQRDYVAGGRDRHRLTFDFAEGDAEGVAEQISSAFDAAGYYVRPKMDTTDGSLQIPLTKKDLGTTYLSVRLLPETANPNPNRKGYFFIDFLVVQAAATSPTAAN